LRFFVQDVQKSIVSIPEILAQMVKESTDFLAKNFEKRNADLKMELLKGNLLKGIDNKTVKDREFQGCILEFLVFHKYASQ
jgi:hypothetical protein